MSKDRLLPTVSIGIFWVAAAITCFYIGWCCIEMKSSRTALNTAGYVASILAISKFLTFVTAVTLHLRNKPPVEAMMISRLYKLGALVAVICTVTYSLGQIASFWTFFSLFGGLMLGLSLQTPISGLVAWILICLKRPFRPGDRVQFPSLTELTGDVKEIGIMYTVLDQVGGTVGSEEAVGRDVLIPNAMLFSQVVINYTTIHEASFMLDEVVVRITYDSNWDAAEKILLDAAGAITGDIIQATGVSPYIRSDLYDYGLYMRLRYQTRVRDRAEIASKINRKIFEEIQRIPTVDIAIPFIYSYRSALDIKEEQIPESTQLSNLREIAMDAIHVSPFEIDPQELQQLEVSISKHGLVQPIIVREKKEKKPYDLLSGHMRYEACRRLGWSTITAIVRPAPPIQVTS